MWAPPSRRSLLRLLIGAAFVLLGWVLSSSTAAHADDRGVLGAVASAAGLPAPAAAPASTVVEEVAHVVPAATSAVTEAVETVVAGTPVAPVASETVSAAADSVASVVSVASDEVVASVVEVVEVVAGVEEAVGLVPALPTVPTVPVVPSPTDVLPGPTTQAPTGSAESAPVPAPGALRAEETHLRSLRGAHDAATGSQVAPLFGVEVRDVAHGRPVAPSDREPVVPGPAWDLGALSPTSSPSLTVSLAVLGMALLLLRPELRCAAARSGRQVLTAGPSWDPGSRPG